ncbi:MAG: DUF302 domain-containing protein [Pseudomonadota bacterium]
MKLARTLIALLALAAAPLVHADTATKANPRAVVVEDTSPHDFATTVTRLKEQLAKDGWTLLTEIDLGMRVAKKGVNLPGGLVILELASGGNTIPLLKNEATRYVAGLMPCSVSVYGMADGRVIVSRMNAALLAGMMEPTVAVTMQSSAGKLDQSIARALDKPGV